MIAGHDMRGLVYIKVPKTGSTTLAGINLRIAHRYKSETNGSICSATYHHTRATELGLKKRQTDKTFVWTFLREPVSQIKSFFFWENRLYVDKPRYHAPTFTQFQTFISQSYRDFDYFPQLGYVSPHRLTLKDLKGNETLVQDILNHYDFIGLNERFDESLVVFRLLLGLKAGDILYTKSKMNGEYDAGASGFCRKVPKKKNFVENSEFFKSSFWTQHNVLVEQLYSAVNRSLDLTIDTIIGREKFKQALSYHKYLMYKVNSKCVKSIIFPCSSNGTYQINESKKNCYKYDLGCGYPCVDQIVYQKRNSTDYQIFKKQQKHDSRALPITKRVTKAPHKKKTYQWRNNLQQPRWNSKQQWHQNNKNNFMRKPMKTYRSEYDTKYTILFIIMNWIMSYFVIRFFLSNPFTIRFRKRK